ncbi:MAG TPA: STAS domain-containing protein [Candidatus Binatia bacterium]
MELKTQDIANVTLIQAAGRIDHTTAKDFENRLLPQLAGCTGETKKILLDFSEVNFISSAGLRVLMIAAKQCKRQDGKIVLAALQPMIQEVFQISRFDSVFEVFPTVKAAMEAISAAAAATYGGR